MSDLDGTLAELEREPERLPAHVAELRTVLEGDDDEAKKAVLDTLRVVADTDPAVMAEHVDLLRPALTSENRFVVVRSATPVAAVASFSPTAVADMVPELQSALETVQAPEYAAISNLVGSLAVVHRKTDTDASAADGRIAELLRHEDTDVRCRVAEQIAATVQQHPRDFPETLDAFVDALESVSPRLKEPAVKTVTYLASADPEVVPRIENVWDELLRARDNGNLDAETIEKALYMTEPAVPEGAG